MWEQSSQGAYAEDRGICILAVDIPSVYLLLRRGEYTRVYTTVYLRVYNSVPACTQLYTHVYTTVYPRVHNLALSMSPGELLCTVLLGANV